MIILISLCDPSWLWLFLWLLPLITFILGWLMNGFLKNKRIRLLENELNTCILNRKKVQGEFDGLNSNYIGLKGDHQLLNNRYDELSLNYKTEKSNKKGKEKKDNKEKANKSITVDPIVGGASLTAKPSEEKSKLSSNKGSLNYDVHARLKNDNLQIIEGVGPKMEELLKKNSINTWSDLSKHDGKSLRQLLDNENPKRYKIIDPTTWGEQARYAANGNWNVLTDFQRNLDTGRTNTLGKTDAKVEKVMIRLGLLKKWKQDDLKAVEGIGPKIEGLFHDAGIMTWKALSETSVDRLKEILKAAGDRYRLADPGTWPEQSRMAHEGLWDKLNEYQDFLQGGK